jgi:hypothetical protein
LDCLFRDGAYSGICYTSLCSIGVSSSILLVDVKIFKILVHKQCVITMFSNLLSSTTLIQSCPFKKICKLNHLRLQFSVLFHWLTEHCPSKTSHIQFPRGFLYSPLLMYLSVFQQVIFFLFCSCLLGTRMQFPLLGLIRFERPRGNHCLK